MGRAPSSVLVNGGKWDSAASGVSGGGRRLRVRLPPRGVRESAARGMVMAAQIGIWRLDKLDKLEGGADGSEKKESGDIYGN